MADEIFESIAIRRELIEGVTQRTALEKTLAKFIGPAFYGPIGVKPAKLLQLRDDVLRQVTREFLPFAREIGREAAKPILDAMPVSSFTAPGSRARTRAIANLRTFSTRNLAQFRVKLARDISTMSDSVKVAFAEAARDNVARKNLIDQLVAADRAEHARLAQVGLEQDAATRAVQDAEEAVAKASNRGQKKARRQLRDSKKALKKAKAKITPSRLTSFYVRFENAVQGEARDVVRRESEMAMRGEFLRRGHRLFVWIAVNGSDACPSCADRHGGEFTASEAAVDGPGAGGTYCQGACMCVLVPDSHAKNNPALAKPLTILGNRREPRAAVPTLKASGRSTGKPPKDSKLGVIKAGGKNAEIAKRAKKRANQ